MNPLRRTSMERDGVEDDRPRGEAKGRVAVVNRWCRAGRLEAASGFDHTLCSTLILSLLALGRVLDSRYALPLLIFAVSFLPPLLFAWLALFPVRWWAARLGLLDQPGERKVHTVATPLGGGLGIWFGIIVTFAAGTAAVALAREAAWLADALPPVIAASLDSIWSRAGEIWGLLTAATALTVLGFLDDRRGLPALLRLVVQFLIAGAVVWGLGYELTAFIPVPWLTELLSVVWIVAVINSFNMLDNMDGLSGGVAAIVAGMLAAVMLTTPDPASQQPQMLVASLLLVVSGSLVGFLFHNRPPAKIFMGDAGSYLVGFLVAVATLLATYAGYQEVERPHAVFAPLCAMAVPLYDMITVLWIRVREGRSPLVGDKSHLSHRLVDLGLGKGQAVLTIYLMTATCGLAALLLVQVEAFGALLVGGVVACMLILIAILESTGWQKDGR